MDSSEVSETGEHTEVGNEQVQHEYFVPDVENLICSTCCQFIIQTL